MTMWSPRLPPATLPRSCSLDSPMSVNSRQSLQRRFALGGLALLAGFAIAASRGRNAILVASVLSVPDTAEFVIPSDTTPVSLQYFGLHIHRAVAMSPSTSPSAWPAVGFGSWRLWDAHVAWPDIEPSRGKWDFSRLDALCRLARSHGVTVLLPLGLTPPWASARPTEKSNYGLGNQAPPADTADWRRYVDTVAKRYRGQIEAYEIWNEPNVGGFYSGTPAQLGNLARIAFDAVKKADANAIVTTPAASGLPGGLNWLANYLSIGGGKDADVVAFHFYVTPRDPEDMFRAMQIVRQALDATPANGLPLWNTETGWLMQNAKMPLTASAAPGSFASRVLDDTTAAAFVARALILGRCASVSRFYWYAWDNGKMGLTEADGRSLKSAARAYAAVGRWLVGTRVRSCQSLPNGTWVVQVARPGRRASAIIWSTRGPGTYDFRASVRLTSQMGLLDTLALDLSRSDTHAVSVSEVPILVGYR